MAAKKSAGDRVIAELHAERDAIDKTIARLMQAQQTANTKKKQRKPREARDVSAAAVAEDR